MTPIEKNIIVIDQNGTQYEPTYPKRAKGLVKNGRARFVDEHTICLACPPHEESEEFKMEEKDIKKVVTDKPPELTMEYVLTQIDRIVRDQAHIHIAIGQLGSMAVNEGPEGGKGDQARGQAIAAVVGAREATNQQMLKLFEKMYDDLKPKTQADIVRHVEELLNNNPVLIACVKAISEGGIGEDSGEAISNLYDTYDLGRRNAVRDLIAKMK